MTTTPALPGIRGNPPGRHGRDRFTLYDSMPWQFIADLEQLSADQRNTALLWAVEAGWTPSTLGLALGVRRQQIMRWIGVARYTPSASRIPIPEPPESLK